MYDTVKETLHVIMSTVKSEVALTVEEWDTISGESFVTFSVCYHLVRDCMILAVMLVDSCCRQKGNHGPCGIGPTFISRDGLKEDSQQPLKKAGYYVLILTELLIIFVELGLN